MDRPTTSTITPTSLTIPGAFFRSGYAVYMVEIAHRPTAQTYYYLGQTGDAAHRTARAPFYRMSGHFDYGRHSTQNQIFRGLCKVLGVEEDPENQREKIEAFLAEAVVRYHVFRLHDFSYQSDKAEHRKRRHTTLAVETALIRKFKERHGHAILNSKSTSLKREPTETEEAQIDQIMNELTKMGMGYE